MRNLNFCKKTVVVYAKRLFLQKRQSFTWKCNFCKSGNRLRETFIVEKHKEQEKIKESYAGDVARFKKLKGIKDLPE